MPRNDWASWVQAIGSIAAIIAAFTIAWGQYQLERARRLAVAKVRAELAATAVLLKLMPLVGAMNDLQSGIQHARAGRTFDIGGANRMLAALTFPADDEVLAIADHDALCSQFLVRGRAFANQAALAINVLVGEVKRWPTDSEWGEIAGLFAVAHKQWSLAKERLEAIVPKGNG